MPGHENQSRIPTRSALSSIAQARQDSDLVLTNQGSARVWPLIASHQLDFHFNPSTMGGVIPLGLGLAIAQPHRKVIVLTGDGSLLMSLGSLVSAVAADCPNLSVILLDNRIYDVTGGQKTAATALNVKFDDMARSVGFATVESCADEKTWQSQAKSFLQQEGPSFCWLKVDPGLPDDMQTRQEPMPQQLERIRRELTQ